MARFFPPLLVAIGLLVTPARVEAIPSGSARAREAFALCQLAENRSGESRVDLLTRGLALAEAEVDADEHDALAQFALFCNLGRRIQAAGFRVAAPFEILRALRALDAAVELAPDDPDVVAAKGAILVQLPKIFGGDEAEGEHWLRRALALDPQHGVARRYLADTAARHSAGDVDARRATD